MKPINEIVAKYIGEEEETAWQKHVKSQLNGRNLGDMDDEETKKFFAQAKKTFKGKVDENSTDDAAATAKAAIGQLEKREDLDAAGKEILTKLKGMMDYYKKEGSFSPAQAKAIYNISQGLKKASG